MLNIKKNIFIQIFIWSCLVLTVIVLSCTQSETASNFEGELFIKMLDSPANLEQLNISIDRVSIHRAGAASDGGWSYASTEPTGSINLLRLRNGISQKIVLNSVAVGEYDQIRIHFGACTVIENGLETLMEFDSTIQYGRHLSYSFEIVEGKRTQLTFDFDVSRSIYKSAVGYIFRPVIRVQNTLLSGSILGSVLGPDSLLQAAANVMTYTGLDSVSTLTELSSGSFRLADLPEAVYTVTIVSGDTRFLDTTLTNLTVVRQQETNAGSIRLRKK